MATCLSRVRVRGMGEARVPRIRVKFERNGAFDLARGPQGHREVQRIAPTPDPKVRTGTQIVVALGLKQSESVFKMIPRFAVLSGEPMRDSGRAVCDSGLRQIGSCLDVAEEGRRVRPHRGQLAAHVAADPQTVVGRQPFRRVFVASRRRARPCEGFGRFRRAL